MKSLTMIALSGMVLVLGATLSAQPLVSSQRDCNGCTPGQTEVAKVPAKSITVVGVLTNEGIECQALRADDGTLYTLTGNLKKFRNRDRVQVTGEIAEFSFCQQGITINVHSIKKAR